MQFGISSGIMTRAKLAEMLRKLEELSRTRVFQERKRKREDMVLVPVEIAEAVRRYKNKQRRVQRLERQDGVVWGEEGEAVLREEGPMVFSAGSGSLG
tara:strand:+ start:187 stop:480 length:294 start_codon:yes stop_codon:yes gene_type:complete